MSSASDVRYCGTCRKSELDVAFPVTGKFCEKHKPKPARKEYKPRRKSRQMPSEVDSLYARNCPPGYETLTTCSARNNVPIAFIVDYINRGLIPSKWLGSDVYVKPIDLKFENEEAS